VVEFAHSYLGLLAILPKRPVSVMLMSQVTITISSSHWRIRNTWCN